MTLTFLFELFDWKTFILFFYQFGLVVPFGKRVFFLLFHRFLILTFCFLLTRCFIIVLFFCFSTIFFNIMHLSYCFPSCSSATIDSRNRFIMMIRVRNLSSNMISIILINVISIPFYMILDSFWFFFASIDKYSNQIENRIEHIFMVVHFLLFQQLYI